jgi:hypothetical protein
MDALTRFIQAFMAMNLGMTAVELASERGGRFLFTFVVFVLALTAAPYLAAMAGMRRLPARWAIALGIAAALFGAADAALRMQALYFPRTSTDPAMAVWLPITSVVVIPVLAAVAYPFVRLSHR